MRGIHSPQRRDGGKSDRQSRLANVSPVGQIGFANNGRTAANAVRGAKAMADEG
jgi:hypothetical protein